MFYKKTDVELLDLTEIRFINNFLIRYLEIGTALRSLKVEAYDSELW